MNRYCLYQIASSIDICKLASPRPSLRIANSIHWPLPSSCRDEGLTAEFERSGPLEGDAWPYYKDLRKTHLLSVEDLANMADNESGDRTYYMTTEWYVARCLFYWRKMERAERLGTTIEKSFLDTSIDAHSISSWHHCAHVYLEWTPREQISTADLVGFGDPVGFG